MVERCLAALFAQNGDANFEVILADNGSADFAPDVLRVRFPELKIVDNGTNLGFAAGNNRAVTAATGDWLAFINPDAFAEPDWLSAITNAIVTYPDTALFASVQVDAENPHKLDGAGDGMTFFGFPFRMGFGHKRQAFSVSEVFAPCGAAFVIRRDVFEALGGFEESFFNYCEDADLAFRARLMGHRCLLIPEAVVEHVGSATLGERSDFALYHGTRNRLWLYVRNMPLPLLLLTAPVHALLSLAILLKDALNGRRVVWRALRDGFKGLPQVWAQRGRIQKLRRVDSLRLAQSLTWNPSIIARRSLDHRRLS